MSITAAEVGAAEQISDRLNYINEVLDAVDTYSLFIVIKNAQDCKVYLIEQSGIFSMQKNLNLNSTQFILAILSPSHTHPNQNILVYDPIAPHEDTYS